MELSGWGRYPRIDARGDFFETTAAAAELIAGGYPWIAHGAGRSYGDSALERYVIFTRRFDRLIHFDDRQGILHCTAGMTLADILGLILPRGWFLKVTPGTKHVTVGGAIAADVHGKNHHQSGCFSTSVLSLRLMLPDGRVMTCSRQENAELFRATCGGMGLTGLILDAVLQLQAVKSAYVRETTIACPNLDKILETFKRFENVPYSVAWIDCFSQGGGLGRGLIMLGEHVDDGGLSCPGSRSLTVPEAFPSMLVNGLSVQLFNDFYYSIAGRPRSARRVSLDRFFYPLDRFEAWNRVYGDSGFIQYQFVIPEAAGPQGLRTILEMILGAGRKPFLGVLKLFGPENDNLLSFPLQGYTLALDFKVSAGLFPLLDELDAVVLAHGGRHYLAKDARMNAAVFERGYPKAAEFQTIREQCGLSDKINSLQSRRLAI